MERVTKMKLPDGVKVSKFITDKRFPVDNVRGAIYELNNNHGNAYFVSAGVLTETCGFSRIRFEKVNDDITAYCFHTADLTDSGKSWGTVKYVICTSEIEGFLTALFSKKRKFISPEKLRDLANFFPVHPNEKKPEFNQSEQGPEVIQEIAMEAEELSVLPHRKRSPERQSDEEKEHYGDAVKKSKQEIVEIEDPKVVLARLMRDLDYIVVQKMKKLISDRDKIIDNIKFSLDF
jgi:hypothetical protein